MKKQSKYGGIEEDSSPKSMIIFFVVGFLLAFLPFVLTI
jgi:hypothetical protein